MKVSEKISWNHSPAVLGMSMIAGLGVILIVIALAVGVVQGAAADSNSIGIAFISGIALFVLGAVGWFGLTQPQKHFDDINQPLDDGSHGHAETHDEHAIVPAPESHPTVHH
ncbi:MAG: hypothetical protein GC179_07800 [Anaerolineaceae bacterium]|nr:hypothetical protein [Anaerolineaceae bacterium]